MGGGAGEEDDVIPIEEGDRRRRLLKRRSTNLQKSGAGEVRTHTNQGPAERKGARRADAACDWEDLERSAPHPGSRPPAPDRRRLRCAASESTTADW